MDVIPSRETPAPARHTQSRLPPRTDARKAPRKATTTTPATPGPSKVTKSKPKAKDTKQAHGTNTSKPTASASMAHKSVKEVREAAAAELKTRKPRKPLSEEKSKEYEALSKELLSDEVLAKIAAKCGKRESSPAPAPEPPNKQVPQSPRPQRPRSRFKYSLTPKLENIKRAFGEDDWTAYVTEVEKHELGEIHDSECEKQERRIFQTPSIPGLRMAIKRMVVEQMVDLEVTHWAG
ncbi:hypothetical protein E8E12_007407 [Didymella heteroderae]|uniref:Uncharacterized protein n=1 Tax=Didymella heteroderae TaxID=1769908 RepID=A0A9P4WQ86_9PLEO|nr:hypothetical protein E8E12_007407 [Didymella heteroderae]